LRKGRFATVAKATITLWEREGRGRKKKCPAVSQAELDADFLETPPQSQTSTSAFPLLLHLSFYIFLFITPLLLSSLYWLFISFAQLWRKEMWYHVAKLCEYFCHQLEMEKLYSLTQMHIHTNMIIWGMSSTYKSLKNASQLY